MTKSIPEKCKKCAMLSATQAQELHGNDGDRCWNQGNRTRFLTKENTFRNNRQKLSNDYI
jgi:hypothetical protein